MLYFFESREKTYWYTDLGDQLRDSDLSGRAYNSLTLPEDFDHSALTPFPIVMIVDSFRFAAKSPNLYSA